MGISFRGFVIGLIAAIAASLITSYAELAVQYIQIGFLQLPPVVVGLFVFLLLASAWAGQIKQRFALTAQELLTIYCMMLFAAMISSRGLLEKVLPLLVTPAYFATEGNKWAELYFPHIKKWMVSFDPGQADPNTPQLVAKRFFEGLRAGESIPWHQWIGPLVWWGILALLIFGAFMCLASILRRQWVDNEKLTFPLAQLPLEMARDDRKTGFLRNRLTWAGFAVPAVVFAVNGLHGWFPAVPQFLLEINLNQYFTNPPFNSIDPTTMFVSFAAIGFFFLLPAEILFSLWFFFILTRVQQVVATAYNMDMPGMPVYPTKLFIGYQVMGAYFVLAAYLFYVSVPHLKRVLRSTAGLEKADDSNELLPYRSAVIGLVLCFLGSALWLSAAGMSAWLALLVMGLFVFVIAVVMARSTAEGGLLMTETSFRPVDVYRMFAPTHTLGAANMSVLAFTDAGLFRDLRGLVLTGFLDGLKIADGARIKRRAFLPVFFVVGALVTAFLAYMRLAFHWWPLHPLGYALCGSWTMVVFWFPCFVAWIIKSTVMRYGGMKQYVRARPFFLGMIMGEFSMAVIWALIAWATRAPAPTFPWP